MYWETDKQKCLQEQILKESEKLGIEVLFFFRKEWSISDFLKFHKNMNQYKKVITMLDWMNCCGMAMLTK